METTQIYPFNLKTTKTRLGYEKFLLGFDSFTEQ